MLGRAASAKLAGVAGGRHDRRRQFRPWRSAMTMKYAFRVAGAAAAIALVLGGVAYAITSSTFTYNAPKTGWYALSPMAFAPNTPASADDYLIAWPNHPGVAGGYLGSATGACFTGVNLPHGAKMTDFTMRYAAQTNQGLAAYLFRTRASDGVSNVIGQLVASNTSGTRQTANDNLPATGVSTVNNTTYVYSVGVCVQAGGNVYYNGRITYTYTSAGD
jgi:hypothetical protein